MASKFGRALFCDANSQYAAGVQQPVGHILGFHVEGSLRLDERVVAEAPNGPRVFSSSSPADFPDAVRTFIKAMNDHGDPGSVSFAVQNAEIRRSTRALRKLKPKRVAGWVVGTLPETTRPGAWDTRERVPACPLVLTTDGGFRALDPMSGVLGWQDVDRINASYPSVANVTDGRVLLALAAHMGVYIR